MDTVDGTRLNLGTLALDTFAKETLGEGFERQDPGDRGDAFFDLLTALHVVADLDPALDWDDALARCEEFYPARARA